MTVIGEAPPLQRVKTLSGQYISVQGKAEKDYFDQQQRKYMKENTFTAAADLQDLDRLLFLELLVHRATCWLASGYNYSGELLTSSEESDCRKVIKENSPLISTLKNDLTLTKSQRDREQYESVGGYILKLQARARETGVRREKQLGKALALINECFAMVGAYDRADEIERQKLGLESAEDVLDWVRTVMRPEYDAIDSYFREHSQRFWVRDL